MRDPIYRLSTVRDEEKALPVPAVADRCLEMSARVLHLTRSGSVLDNTPPPSLQAVTRVALELSYSLRDSANRRLRISSESLAVHASQLDQAAHLQSDSRRLIHHFRHPLPPLFLSLLEP